MKKKKNCLKEIYLSFVSPRYAKMNSGDFPGGPVV